MDSLIDDLEKLTIDINKQCNVITKENKKKEVDNICERMSQLVLEKKATVNELITEFVKLEVKTKTKLDSNLWGALQLLMMKPQCRFIINQPTLPYVGAC